MLPPFCLGLGGPVASGRQYLPWIHLHDLAAVIVAAISDERYQGPVNAAAPNPVTSRDFARALGTALHRPARLTVPGPMLRILLGEAAIVLLGSQRIHPAVLRARGFLFAFPTIDRALADILGGAPVAVRPSSGPAGVDGNPDGSYLQRRPPAYELRATATMKVPVEEAFAFFSRAENLGLLTPAAMQFSISGRVPEISEGATIDYRLQVGPVPIGWRSRIVAWRPGTRFVDQQERGPYRSWYHEHAFRAEGTSTVMEDRVYYAPPLSLLGRLANRLFIAPTLRRIFQYRADVIRLRFGAV
jgi:ligand-binding SRPBCC domain-containing protein